MKIIVNDLMKEETNSKMTDDEIIAYIIKLIPELDKNNINISIIPDPNDPKKDIIELEYDNGQKIKLGRIDDDRIQLTTTEIRMILNSNDNTPINTALEKTNDELLDELRHQTEVAFGNGIEPRVLELHTHFIEVLDAETFVELFGEDFLVNGSNDTYNVNGKNYTKEQLIKALEYPLDHQDGTNKAASSYKTVAFTKLSEIVSLRQVLLSKEKKIGDKASKDELIYRFQKLLLASLIKLEREGVEYTEFSLSKLDLEDLLTSKPNNENIPFQNKEKKENKENKENKEINYDDPEAVYKELQDRLKDKKGTIKVRFLRSTQRDLGRTEPTKYDQKLYLTPYEKIIIELFLDNLQEKKMIGKVLDSIIKPFINLPDTNVEKKAFLDNLLEKLKLILKGDKAAKQLKTLKDTLDNVAFLNQLEELVKWLEADKENSISKKENSLMNEIKKIEEYNNKIKEMRNGTILYDEIQEIMKYILSIDKNFVGKIESEKVTVGNKIIYKNGGMEVIDENGKKREASKEDKKALLNLLGNYLNLKKDNLQSQKRNISSCKVLFYHIILKKLKEIGEFVNLDISGPHIVGYDIMGFESKMDDLEKTFLEIKIRRAFDDYIDELTKEKETGIHPSKSLHSNKRIIRIHAGETRESSGNVLAILEIIRKIKQDYPKQFEDFEFRIGHGIYWKEKDTDNLDDIAEKMKELGVVIEVNMSSNYALDNVDRLDQIPLHKITSHGVRFVQSTDGGGAYIASLIGEQLLKDRYFINNGSSGNIGNPNTSDNEDSKKDENKESSPDDTSKIDDKRVVELLNACRNLDYIFHKDFNLSDLANSNEILSKFRSIEEKLKSGEYAKAEIELVSCQILMNCDVYQGENIQETRIFMDLLIECSREEINNILNNEDFINNKKNKEFCNMVRLLNGMSDRDLLIYTPELFIEKNLYKVLKNTNENMISINNEEIENINNILFGKIKNRVSNLSSDELENVVFSLIVENQKDKSKMIEHMISAISYARSSDRSEFSNLRSENKTVDLEEFEKQLKNISPYEISNIFMHKFIYNKNINELSSILTVFYKQMVESGEKITLDQFLSGFYELNEKEVGGEIKHDRYFER